MSIAEANNLSKYKIERLLGLARLSDLVAADESAQTGATEHNWKELHYFSREQLGKVQGIAAKAAASLAEKLTALSKSPCTANVTSVTQHCADEFVGDGNGYRLAFGAGKEASFGVVNLPRQTAMIWIRRLLGDSESQDADKPLLQLEESMLSDITQAVIGAFSKACGNLDCRPEGIATKGLWPITYQEADELCRIALEISQENLKDGSIVELIIPCRRLEAIIGKTGQAATSSAEDVSKMLLGHLEKTPVSVTTLLGTTRASFGQVMDLEVDDVVVLDRKIDEPIELMVAGRTVLRGWCAKSEGQYAIAVNYSSCATGG